MNKYLLIIMLAMASSVHAYDRSPNAVARSTRHNRCCSPQFLCIGYYCLRNMAFRAMMRDPPPYIFIKKNFNSIYTRVDLAIALILFVKHQGESFDRFMLDDFGRDNYFRLKAGDFRLISTALAGVRNTEKIEIIYEQLWYLNNYEKKAMQGLVRFHASPIFYATYKSDHIKEEHIEKFELGILEILKEIDESD